MCIFSFRNSQFFHTGMSKIGYSGLTSNALSSFLACLLVSMLISCHPAGNSSHDKDTYTTILLKPDFAQGFRIIRENEHEYLEIYDPWKKDQLLSRILLTRKATDDYEHQENNNSIKIPVSQFITLSSTQWGMLLQLGAAHKIAAISEAPFVKNNMMRELLKMGKVVEVARDGLFRYELLSEFSGAVLLYSPDATGLPEPLLSLNLVPLPWPDFTEPHPLGRAEWFRLLGYITDNQHFADSIFGVIAKEYIKLSEMALRAVERPKVFSDKLFAGQWYVPGGKSYIARIMTDAGADYVFSNLQATGSVPLDPEAIISKASEADFWRIPHAGNIGGYAGLLAENPFYGEFAAFRNRRVIFCNTLASGYFEQGPLEPHLLLADFIAIFHPEILPDHKPKYHYLLQ